MGTARFEITGELIEQSLGIPSDVKIVQISTAVHRGGIRTFRIRVEGDCFPDGITEAEPIMTRREWDWNLQIKSEAEPDRKGSE